MSTNLGLLLLGAMIAGSTPVANAGSGTSQDDPPAPRVAGTTVGTEIDDTVVTAKVKSALYADPNVSGFDLKVETRKGVVRLSGFVDSQSQIDRALEVAGRVEGVASIEDGIGLEGAPASVGNLVDDSIITTRVKSALLSDPNIRSFDIAVVTRRGEVQLSGFVDSQTQIDRAVAIAGRVTGVTRVGNEMSVKQ